MTREERIEYLEDERKKIWEKVISLEELLNKKTSDYENEAKLSAEQSTEFRKAAEEAKNTIVQDLDEINLKLTDIRAVYNSIEELNTKIKEYANNAEDNNKLIKAIYDNIESKSATINSQIAEVEKIFTSIPTLEANSKSLNDIFIRGNENDSKINALYEAITSRKKEIDDLYYQIIGVTETDKATGTETHTPGLKSELENSYVQLRSSIEVVVKDLDELKTRTSSDYTTFIGKKATEFKESMTKWEKEFSDIQKEITKLLPHALTVGLSFAYAEKKEAEEKESNRLLKTFYFAIGGLIIVSLIPFGISIKSIFDNTALEQVILRVPRLVLAILPLYIPVLWVAYSSNRKLNLSKRLIEEYSHKEVLSKTFEGLSKQINNIDDKEISSDLRIRLLYNILEVNSENPGKLISDYNKSDHPLMDTLDKSVKLTDAITRLSKIPGFSKLAKKLAKREEEIIQEMAKKADAGIEIVKSEKIKENGGVV